MRAGTSGARESIDLHDDDGTSAELVRPGRDIMSRIMGCRVHRNSGMLNDRRYLPPSLQVDDSDSALQE